MALLQVDHMTHFFGGLRAVHDYNLSLEAGQIRGLIGPNGAGKTTVFNLITGIYTPTEGQNPLEGRRSPAAPPPDRRPGMGGPFRTCCLWRHMTVPGARQDGPYSRISYGLMGAFFGTPRTARKAIEEKAHTLLELVGSITCDSVVVNLPYGAQRRVELARALATEPKVLFPGRTHRRHDPRGAGPDDGDHPPGAPSSGWPSS
jgi:branched-chain amino acid transport system ATP-binding protein